MIETLRRFYDTHKAEIFFVIFCFLFYFAWALFIPYGQGPDEDMRYDIAHFIYKYNKLPFGDEPEIVNSIWGVSYAYTPILAYQIAAIFMKGAALFGMADDRLFIAARIANVFIATASSIFIILISRKCFKRTDRFVFATLVCLLPQFVFISAYVNNDALAMLSTAMIFYAWILGLEHHWDIKSVVLLAIGISLCSLSYYNAYGFILCSIILYVGDYLINRKQWSLKKFLTFGCLIIIICAALAGWWFIRSAILHDGDILGMKSSTALSEILAQENYKPSLRMTPQNLGCSLWGMVFGFFHETQWIYQTAISFLGNFGSVSIPLGMKAYIMMLLIYAVGGVGFVIEWFKSTRKKVSCRGHLWYGTLILAILIPVILSIYYSYTSDFQPQGRYVMPLLIPLMYCLTRGIRWVEDWLNRKKNKCPLGVIIILINSTVAMYAFCVIMARAYGA